MEMPTAADLRKVRDLHESLTWVPGSLKFSISEEEDGSWSVAFDDGRGFQGLMHPKSFCSMIIEWLNRRE